MIIGTRIYPINDIRTGIMYETRDIMSRNDVGAFTLKRTTNGHPGEPETECAYSHSDVFEWLQDMPEQIERSVIDCASH